MKIHFHGATGGVTGSAYHVVTKHASILVDCGMFQGSRKEKVKNRREAKLEGGRLDARAPDSRPSRSHWTAAYPD